MNKLDENLLNLIEKRAEGHSKIDYIKMKLNDLFCVCVGVGGDSIRDKCGVKIQN